MTDDLVKRLRYLWEDENVQDAGVDLIMAEAADRIEALERELAEEGHYREIAAAKAWEFAQRIKELEKKNDQ